MSSTFSEKFLLILHLIPSRPARGRNSSPFSTCRSTLAAWCPLWSHPSWEVSVEHMWFTHRGPLCDQHQCVLMLLFAPAGDVQCFGGDCYALAFGVPAALMIVALGECPSTYNTLHSHGHSAECCHPQDEPVLYVYDQNLQTWVSARSHAKLKCYTCWPSVCHCERVSMLMLLQPQILQSIWFADCYRDVATFYIYNKSCLAGCRFLRQFRCVVLVVAVYA